MLILTTSSHSHRILEKRAVKQQARRTIIFGLAIYPIVLILSPSGWSPFMAFHANDLATFSWNTDHLLWDGLMLIHQSVFFIYYLRADTLLDFMFLGVQQCESASRRTCGTFPTERRDSAEEISCRSVHHFPYSTTRHEFLVPS